LYWDFIYPSLSALFSIDHLTLKGQTRVD
jgi:hypothetical protein